MMTVPTILDGRLRQHPLYREAQTHLQQAEWEDVLRCLDGLHAEFPDDPELEALEQEIHLRARADKYKPRLHLGSILPWRKLVFFLLLSVTVVGAGAVGVVAFQQQIAPRLEQNRRIVQIETTVSRGQFALARGNYAEAARQFEAVLALAPDDQRAREGLHQAEWGKELVRRYQSAVDLVEAERWSEAYRALMAVAELEPGYRDVDTLMEQVARQLDIAETFRAAEEAFQTGAWRDAISRYKMLRSLDLTYERSTVTAHLSRCYLEMARELAAQIGTNDEAATEALNYFNKVLALRPRDPEAVAGRQEMQDYLDAVELVKEQDWENAIPRLEALWTVRPDYADGKVAGWLFMGCLLTGDQATEAGNFALAAERYGLLLELAQETEGGNVTQLYDMHLAAGDAAVRSEDYALALFRYQEALKVAEALGPDAHPPLTELHVRVAELALENKDPVTAVDHYRQAVMLTLQETGEPHRELVAASLERAEEAVEQKDYAAAVEEYKQALQAAESEPPRISTSPPSIESIVYTVVPGDTVSKLALRFNTTVEDIVALNNLSSPDLIEVGQVLIIPTGTH